MLSLEHLGLQAGSPHHPEVEGFLPFDKLRVGMTTQRQHHLMQVDGDIDPAAHTYPAKNALPRGDSR